MIYSHEMTVIHRLNPGIKNRDKFVYFKNGPDSVNHADSRDTKLLENALGIRF